MKTERDLVTELRAMCLPRGAKRAMAKSLGISAQYMGDILSGRNKISDRIADKLGYRRITMFERAD